MYVTMLLVNVLMDVRIIGRSTGAMVGLSEHIVVRCKCVSLQNRIMDGYILHAQSTRTFGK